MKNLFQIVIMAGSMLLAAGCSATKEQKPENETVEIPAAENEFISGTVTEIQQGKDGYTATLKTAGGAVYLATVSRANLTDPGTFRTVEIGEALSVKGDMWQMENQNHITVRELK